MIEGLVRANIKRLVPYSSARGEFSGKAAIFLDANENGEGSPVGVPYAGKLERYPDPKQTALKAKVASQRGVKPEQVFVGNGSDEGIDLLIRACCEPGKESILITEPSYPMYEVAAGVQDVSVIRVPLGKDFSLDAEAVLKAVTPETKIVFLCSPNNPTANLLSRDAVKKVIKGFPRLVVIDEAYIEFAPEASWLSELSHYRNVVVLQTLSKAYGLAGARVGFLFGDSELVAVLSKIKSPYNVSVLAQELALSALEKTEIVRQRVQTIKTERARFIEALKEIPSVKEVYPTDANFFMVRVDDSKRWVATLRDQGIIVRDRSNLPGCANCVRVTVGTAAENDSVLAVLNGKTLEQPRTAAKRRATNETDIRVEVNLDGSGRSKIETGLGFFDHMLDQLAKHSGMDLTVCAKGDLHIDEHHTIEDTAIAIGATLKEALGDKRGIERYGFVLAMDEAKATVALDLSGRSYLVWNVKLTRERVGELPTEMVQHFFKSLSDAAGMTLNVEATGENDHHIIEAIFKGFARSLKSAISRGKGSELPSTKGVL